MGSEPSEQVKRVYSVMKTLEEKSQQVKMIQEDINQKNLALGEAIKARDNARVQLAAELERMDPGLAHAMASREEKSQRKAS